MNMRKTIQKLIGYEVHKTNTGYWTNAASLDQDSIEVYNRHTDLILVRPDQMYQISQFLKYALTLDGDVAELGVYKGGTAVFIADIMQNSAKTFHLFDTFEGLPPAPEIVVKDEFDRTSLEMVKKNLSEFNHFIEYHKGYFPDTAQGLDKEFCFVYLDGDLYQSTKDSLEFFYPKMVKGGVIVLDDYKSKHWPGVKKAIDEFVEGKNISVLQCTTNQAVIIK